MLRRVARRLERGEAQRANIERLAVADRHIAVAAAADARFAAPIEGVIRGTGATSSIEAEIAVTSIDKVDLLFVVDNSGSMREEQTALRAQFPRLIQVLTSGDRDGDSTSYGFRVIMRDTGGRSRLVRNHRQIFGVECSYWWNSRRAAVAKGALVGEQLACNLAPRRASADAMHQGTH